MNPLIIKYLPEIAAVLAVAIVLGWTYHKGGEHASDVIEHKTQVVSHKVQEKKDEIRNNKSFGAYAERLRVGRY